MDQPARSEQLTPATLQPARVVYEYESRGTPLGRGQRRGELQCVGGSQLVDAEQSAGSGSALRLFRV